MSDRGCAFTSSKFQELGKDQDIKLVHIATGTPRANGQAKRVNHTIILVATKLTLTLSQWDKSSTDGFKFDRISPDTGCMPVLYLGNM